MWTSTCPPRPPPPPLHVNKLQQCVRICVCARITQSEGYEPLPPCHTRPRRTPRFRSRDPRRRSSLRANAFPSPKIKTCNTKSSADRWGRWCAVASAYKYFYSPDVPLRHRYDNKKKPIYCAVYGFANGENQASEATTPPPPRAHFIRLY